MINRLAILCGGGPAPGINSVISSAAIEAINHGWEVFGLLDGFKPISKGRFEAIRLTIDQVSRIHTEGGSIIRTSRHNPTVDLEDMERAVDTLADAGISHLITIGGDDTAYSALMLSRQSLAKRAHPIRIAHVPKTIDNDLPLPEGIPTFGFETARSLGAQLLTNIMEDARTTGRWFLCVTMGRATGHLALGIGKSAGATLILIPEEFGPRVSLGTISDLIVGSVIKRLAMGRGYGVAVVAEGLMGKIPPEELEELKTADRDEHGHVRYGEVNFSDALRDRVKRTLRELGIKVTLNDKEIGYELRCAPPNAFDVEYTRNLGYGAFEFLQEGGSGSMVTIQNNRIVPIPLEEIMDPATGRTQQRPVNVESIQYRIARRYMIRLTPHDFQDPVALEALCRAARMDREAFVGRFRPLADV